MSGSEDLPDDLRAELEYWIEVLRVREAFWEQVTLEAATESLAETPDLPPFPMPDTAHPTLERQAAFVRNLGNPTILLPTRPSRPSFLIEEEFPTSMMPEPVVLTRQRILAPAPVVLRWPNDLAAYSWNAWVDNMGRHVTDSAMLVWA